MELLIIGNSVTDSQLIKMSTEPFRKYNTNNALPNLLFYYIGGSLYVGLRLIFQDGDQIYNLQMIITLSSCLLRPYKWLG